jgi:four helix bundle protein
MIAQSFDHERLDVDRLLIDYVARSFEAAQLLEGLHRYARDQWLRAAQSIPLNIAEGNGKRSLKDRARFLDIARRSALVCAAIQGVLVRIKGIKLQDDAEMKVMLHRIVAMLTRMAMRFDGVAEQCAAYDAGIDYDYEHRCAEHEHESQAAETPEPWDATERRW